MLDVELLLNPELLVWDTETTGLTLHPDAPLAKQPRIIEFGAIVLSLKDGSVVEEHSLLINPQEPISEEITKITNITDAMVADQPTFQQRLPQLRHLFARATSHVCHNTPFDRAVLSAELARYPHLEGTADWPWPKEFCTMNLYTPHWGRPPRLIEVYAAIMGKPYEQTHRGLDDVKAMVEIIQKERLWEIMQ